MAFIDRKEQTSGPRGFDIKDEGFSEAYRNFLTSRCRAEVGTDGIFRNQSGSRFCSCDMCGMVATTEMQGRLFCDFHFAYRGHPIEERACTEAMHKLRPLILIAASLERSGHDDQESVTAYLSMYDDACDRLGVQRPTASQSLGVHIRDLIEQWVKYRQAKALERSEREAREGRSNPRDVTANIRRLANKLNVSKSLTPFGSRGRVPHPAETAEDFPM